MSDFVITDAGAADWAIRTIKEERARRDLFIEAANAQIAELQQKTKEVEEACDRETSFLLFKLNEYLSSAPYKKAKTQISLDLPSGKLVRKLPAQDFERDDELLIKTFKGTAYVEETPKLKWKELKATLIVLESGDVANSETGEIIEGIKAIENPETFDVK